MIDNRWIFSSKAAVGHCRCIFVHYVYTQGWRCA